MGQGACQGWSRTGGSLAVARSDTAYEPHWPWPPPPACSHPLTTRIVGGEELVDGRGAALADQGGGRQPRQRQGGNAPQRAAVALLVNAAAVEGPLLERSAGVGGQGQAGYEGEQQQRRPPLQLQARRNRHAELCRGRDLGGDRQPLGASVEQGGDCGGVCWCFCSPRATGAARQ
jgi:hypothetical protein